MPTEEASLQPWAAGAAEAIGRTRAFRDLPAAEVDALARVAEPVAAAPGELLLRAGGPASTHLWLIEAGRVHVEAQPPDPAAPPQLVDVAEAGDVFGAASLLDRSTAARFSVRVVEPLRAFRLPADAVLRAAERFPGVAEVLGERNRRLLRLARAELARAGGGLEPAVELQSLAAPVASLLRRAPVLCAPGESLAAAARRMTEQGVGSLVVVDAERRPLGILTDADLRARVVARERSCDGPVGGAMSRPVRTVGEDAPLLEVLDRLAGGEIGHLVVVGREGRVVGVVSQGDLLRTQGRSPAALLHGLDSAAGVAELAQARQRVMRLLPELLHAGVEPELVTRLVTLLNDRAVGRALRWAEDAADADLGDGLPRPPYAWLALGSEGRREQTLATDQDNALVHTADPLDERALRWLECFARHAVDALERIGFPRCRGGVMASEPPWRRSLAEWERQLVLWTEEPAGTALVHSAIFFDLRPLHGDPALAASLWERIHALARRNDIFLAHLTQDAVGTVPPLRLLGGFALERTGPWRGTLNLKEKAMAPLVDCARVLALAGGLSETNTLLRFRSAAGVTLSRELAEDAAEAFAFLYLVRLQHHLALAGRGEEPHNHLDPHALPAFQRRSLKIAFQVVQQVQAAVASRYSSASFG